MDERAKHDTYTALNKKEILQKYATTCTNLKDIMLNEAGLLTERQALHDSTYMRCLE